MVICVFGIKYREDADLDLEARLTREMAEVVSRMPGFISYKTYRAEDGEEVGLIRFASRAALKAWRGNLAHHGAWAQATRIYHEFWVQNSEVFDDYVWVDGVHHDRDQTDRFQMTPDEVLAAVG
jgi:heme-degrading monooxygenase HmoA